MGSLHEVYSLKVEAERSSDRAFGIVFTVIFLVVALLPLWYSEPVRHWALITSGLLLVSSIIAPAILAPANRLWAKFGLLIGHIVSPIALGVLFYVVFTTIGLLMRLFIKDPLKLKFDQKADTYWIVRNPPGPAPQSLNKQF